MIIPPTPVSNRAQQMMRTQEFKNLPHLVKKGFIGALKLQTAEQNVITFTKSSSVIDNVLNKLQKAKLWIINRKLESELKSAIQGKKLDEHTRVFTKDNVSSLYRNLRSAKADILNRELTPELYRRDSKTYAQKLQLFWDYRGIPVDVITPK